MKIKTKVIIVSAFIILINIMLMSATGMVSVMNGKGGIKNTIKTVNNISELKNITGYNFEYPKFLESETDVKYSIINGTNIQVENSRFKFCVAKYIADDISILGDYNKYTIDEYYKSDKDIRLVHYRIDESCTIVEWIKDDLMYGLIMYNYDGYNGLETLLNELGINLNNMIKCDTT